MKLGKQRHCFFRLSVVDSTKIPLSPRISFWLVPLCSLGLLAVLQPDRFFAETAATTEKNIHAPELYEHAIQSRTVLEGKPKRLRTPAEYQKVIDRFRSVYRQFPASSKVDDALLAVAELYQSMGTDFSEARYFLRAVQAYLFLESEYPSSPHGSGGLFTAAEIYLNDLNDPKMAQQTFRDFLMKYPDSRKARNARARLDDLRTQLLQARKTGAKKGRSSDTSFQVARANATEAKPQPPKPAEGTKSEVQASPLQGPLSAKSEGRHPEPRESRPSGISVVLKELRYWNSESQTRLVIATEQEARFFQGTLENPARVFVDIQNARLAAQLEGKTYSLNDGYVKKVRFGQPKPDVARIVLDIDSIQKCQVFTLSAPARIVIDLTGNRRKGPEAVTSTSNIAWVVKQGEPLADELDLPLPTRKPSTAAKEEKRAVVRSAATEATVSPVHSPEPKDRKALAASAEALQEPPNLTKSSQARASLPKSDGTRSLIRTLGLKIGRIVIDPGHGGHDTGTVGPSGLIEKDLVLDIAVKLKKLIEDRLESEVILTRDDDTFIPLEERTAIANQSGADLFLSIHANSSRNHKVSGVETFFLNFASSADAAEIAARENSSSQKTVFELQDLVQKITLREKVDESREFAHIVQKAMATQLHKARSQTRDRGVKQAPFIVLIGANMPSILSEISFVSNPADEKLLKSSNYRQKVAEALCQGIEAYAEALGGMKTARNLP